MRQRHLFILLVVFATALILKVLYWIVPPKFSHIVIRGQTIRVEVARTPEEQARGLSGRLSLAADRGMLFLYSQKVVPNFWMKNTFVPLDIIWIEGGSIRGIIPHVPPSALGTQDDALPLYTPPVPITMVLEVSAGTAEQWGWKVGDAVRVDL